MDLFPSKLRHTPVARAITHNSFLERSSLFRKYYRSCFNCETIDEELLYERTIGLTWRFVDKVKIML